MLKRIIIVIVLLLAGASQAQEGTTSPYSFYGIGALKFRGTAENRAMGGISVYNDSIHLSIQNPAGVAGLGLVNFTVGGSHKINKQSTVNESERATTTTLDYIALGIPMGKFGASFGVIPYTSVGYKLLTSTPNSTTEFIGSGGLNKVFFTLAYQVTPELSFGVDTNYNFGNIENEAFFQQDELQYGTRELNRSDLSGFSFNLGAAYKKMLTDYLELSTSLTYTLETDFTSENFRQVSTVLVLPSGAQNPVDVRDIDVPNTDFTFPSQLTIGAGIGKPKHWFVGAEYGTQKTSNLVNRTFEIDDIEFNDASKYRLGGFYIPNYNSFGNYWKRVVYRAGFRYEETGISLRGQDINEFGMSFGVGLPVGRLFSNVNLGFEIGKRGTTDFGLIEENFFNIFLSLSLNDRWFEKRYYD